MKKILFIITLLLINIGNVNAEACDAYDIKRLKEIAEGVEITYELQPPVDLESETKYDVYKVNIVGLSDELMIVDKNDKTYYNTSNINELQELVFYGGVKNYQIYSNNCSQVLRSLTLKLPVYNLYASSDECLKKKNKELDICQEWIEDRLTEEEFYEGLYQEKTTNDFIKNNLMKIVIIVIFIILAFIVWALYKRKKEVLV